jgi:hypothetical protein
MAKYPNALRFDPNRIEPLNLGDVEFDEAFFTDACDHKCVV